MLKFIIGIKIHTKQNNYNGGLKGCFLQSFFYGKNYLFSWLILLFEKVIFCIISVRGSD